MSRHLPNWRRRPRASEIPAALRPWIFDRRSLTRRLRAHCPGQFSLDLLSLGWRRPAVDERQALGLAPGRVGLVRQVRLRCAGRPLVYARSVIPSETLRGAMTRLAHLGDRPLADILFARRAVGRGEIEVARLRPGHALHALVASAVGWHGELWARRTVFLPAERPLLVCEVFSPELARGR